MRPVNEQSRALGRVKSNAARWGWGLQVMDFQSGTYEDHGRPSSWDCGKKKKQKGIEGTGGISEDLLSWLAGKDRDKRPKKVGVGEVFGRAKLPSGGAVKQGGKVELNLSVHVHSLGIEEEKQLSSWEDIWSIKFGEAIKQ